MNQTRTKTFGGVEALFFAISVIITALCGCSQPTNSKEVATTNTTPTGETTTYVEQELTNTSWRGAYTITGTTESPTYGEGTTTSRYTECVKFNLDRTTDDTLSMDGHNWGSYICNGDKMTLTSDGDSETVA